MSSDHNKFNPLTERKDEGRAMMIPEEPNWSAFYETLSKVGPLMLTGIRPEIRDFIREEAISSDNFYSASLYDALPNSWKNPEKAIIDCIEIWFRNVITFCIDTSDIIDIWLDLIPDDNHKCNVNLEEAANRIKIKVSQKNFSKLLNSACKEIPKDDEPRIPDESDCNDWF